MYSIVIIFVILMYTHVFMISYVAKNKLNWIEVKAWPCYKTHNGLLAIDKDKHLEPLNYACFISYKVPPSKTKFFFLFFFSMHQ